MGILSATVVLLAAGCFLSLAMVGAWYVQRATGNSGWIDTIWTFSLGVVAIAVALFPYPFGTGFWPRQMLVACLVAIWAARLGFHILVRTRAISDDPRYRAMMTDWGISASRNLFWHLQIQAGVAFLLTVAIGLAAHNPAPEWRASDIVGLCILVAGISGEAIADAQLRRFKRSACGAPVCDRGLWRYSRHPNYFFDWLCWCAYPVIAIDLHAGYLVGWIALAAPALMYWLLTQVSGIPPLEKHMMATREAAFSKYRRRTSPFFPMPPRQNDRLGS